MEGSTITVMGIIRLWVGSWVPEFLDHPKNLIEIIRASLVIAQGLTGENIPTGPNQYHFTLIFLDGEVLHIFDLKPAELRHKTVANMILVMDHVVTYFGPK